MAKLKVVSYTGDSFTFSLNNEAKGPADLGTIKNWLSQTGGKLTWNPNQILFSSQGGKSYFQWKGKFNISKDNKILKGSFVNKFVKNTTDSYGKISITGIKYDAKKEAGSFYSLTVPNEIGDVLKEANKSKYGSEPLEAQAFPGFIYNFQTPYDVTAKEKSSASDTVTIKKPSKFTKKSATKIKNFNPWKDTIKIDPDVFGIKNSATFASGKNKKSLVKKAAKEDFDFLYDKKNGGLYFNENGSGKKFGDGGIIAIFKGSPDIMSKNFDFV